MGRRVYSLSNLLHKSTIHVGKYIRPHRTYGLNGRWESGKGTSSTEKCRLVGDDDMISFTAFLFCIQLKARMLQFEGEVSYMGSNDSFLHVLRCVKTKIFVVWMVGRTLWTLTNKCQLRQRKPQDKKREEEQLVYRP